MSLSDGFTVRAATNDDSEAVAGLARAAEVAVRGASSIGAADIRDWWRLVDLERDTWILEVAGRPAAAATFWPQGEIPHAWGAVHPELVGRGLGSALLDLIEARARRLVSRAVRNDVFAQDELGARLLEGRGYRDVRRSFKMSIDLADEPPPEPEWPEGLKLEPFRVEDATDFHEAMTGTPSASSTNAASGEWASVSTPRTRARRGSTSTRGCTSSWRRSHTKGSSTREPLRRSSASGRFGARVPACRACARSARTVRPTPP